MNYLHHDKLYQHQPVDQSLNQIRLCKLLPATDAKGCRDLALHVEHFVLDDAKHDSAISPAKLAPTYNAVSYMWGSNPQSHTIGVNDGHLLISENLWQFFEVLQSQDELGTWYWVDQICIDQSNVAERNHQVRRMAQIYADAYVVYIWLGPAADDSGSVLASCELHDIAGYFMSANKQDMRIAAQKFMNRPYWNRLWIVQEIFHAQRIVMMCGQDRHPASGFTTHYALSMFAYLRYAAEAWEQKNIQHPLLWRTTEGGRPKRLELYQALKMFSFSLCADSRDKIFGLQGCVLPEQRVTIDYSKSVEEVFCDAFEIMDRYTFQHADLAHLPWWETYVGPAVALEDLRREMGLSQLVTREIGAELTQSYAEVKRQISDQRMTLELREQRVKAWVSKQIMWLDA
jgi:hypothetical protein